MDRRIGASSAVMKVLLRSVVVKRGLNRKAVVKHLLTARGQFFSVIKHPNGSHRVEPPGI